MVPPKRLHPRASHRRRGPYCWLADVPTTIAAHPSATASTVVTAHSDPAVTAVTAVTADCTVIDDGHVVQAGPRPGIVRPLTVVVPEPMKKPRYCPSPSSAN
jgi:hypothetical protein